MSQMKEVRHYLESGGKITPLEALDKFGCFRLAAIVYNLKEEGVEVKTRMIKEGQKTYAEYYLENPSGNKDQVKLFGGK